MEKLTDYRDRPTALKTFVVVPPGIAGASHNKFANPDVETKAAALRAEMEALMAGGY